MFLAAVFQADVRTYTFILKQIKLLPRTRLETEVKRNLVEDHFVFDKVEIYFSENYDSKEIIFLIHMFF